MMTLPGKLDRFKLFEQLASILNELYENIGQDLTLFPKQEQPFRNFVSSDGTIQGSLLTFKGEVIDKLIYSNINALPINFGTMRLTVWLNASIRVPHPAVEFGTIPNLFSTSTTFPGSIYGLISAIFSITIKRPVQPM